jgi:hypothetical protein
MTDRIPSAIRRTRQVNQLRPEEHSHATFHNLRMRHPQRPRMIPYGVADPRRQVNRNPVLGSLAQVRRQIHRHRSFHDSMSSSRLSLSEFPSLFSFTLTQLLNRALSLRLHPSRSRSLARHNDNLLNRPTCSITPPPQANPTPAGRRPTTTTRQFQPPPGRQVPTRRRSTHVWPHQRARLG